MSILSKSIPELTSLEQQTKLSHFNSDVAWNLGNHARTVAQKNPKPIVINITNASGHVLFHTVTKSGTATENDHWVNRKKQLTLRTQLSSFITGQKLKQKNKSLEDAYFMSSQEYSAYGGAVPIWVTSVDSLVGVLTVSGLAQEEDHMLGLEILESFRDE